MVRSRLQTAVLLLLTALALTACEDKAADEAGDNPAASAEEEQAPAATRQPVGDLPLTGMLPSGARVVDQPGGKYVQFGIKLGGVTLEETQMPSTDQAAFVERTTALRDKARNVQSLEVPDGVGVTFEDDSPIGTNYNVQIRRTVGDKHWICRAPAESEAIRQRIIEFCNTLEPK